MCHIRNLLFACYAAFFPQLVEDIVPFCLEQINLYMSLFPYTYIAGTNPNHLWSCEKISHHRVTMLQYT